MNHASAVLIREADGGTTRRKKKQKSGLASYLCPELDMIGRHIFDEDGNCKYCQCEG